VVVSHHTIVQQHGIAVLKIADFDAGPSREEGYRKKMSNKHMNATKQNQQRVQLGRGANEERAALPVTCDEKSPAVG